MSNEQIYDYIKEDKLEEFIIYVTKNNISLALPIETSDPDELLKNKVTPIELAAFFGAIQIFIYLCDQNVKLLPSLWIYAVHSPNVEIINALKEKDVKLDDSTRQKCIDEANRINHHDYAEYLLGQ